MRRRSDRPSIAWIGAYASVAQRIAEQELEPAAMLVGETEIGAVVLDAEWRKVRRVGISIVATEGPEHGRFHDPRLGNALASK